MSTLPLEPLVLLPEVNVAEPPVKSCVPAAIVMSPPTERLLDTATVMSPPLPLVETPPVTEIEPVDKDELDSPVPTVTVPLLPLDVVSALMKSTLPLAPSADVPLEIMRSPPFCVVPVPAKTVTEPPFVAPLPAEVDNAPPVPVVAVPASSVIPPLVVAELLDAILMAPACTESDVFILSAPDIPLFVSPEKTESSPLPAVPLGVANDTLPLAPDALPPTAPLVNWTSPPAAALEAPPTTNNAPPV